MTREECVKLCTFCHGAYGFEAKPQTITIWYEILRDEPFAGLEAAAQRLVRTATQKRAPSPAELLTERDGGNGESRTPTPSGVTTSDFDFHQIVRHRIDSGLLPLVSDVRNGKFSLSFVCYSASLHEKCPVRLRGRTYPGLRRLKWGYEHEAK